jgi:hypothetical protein
MIAWFTYQCYETLQRGSEIDSLPFREDSGGSVKAVGISAGSERCFYAPLQMRVKAAVLESEGGPIEVSTRGLLDPSRFIERRKAQTYFENRIGANLDLHREVR